MFNFVADSIVKDRLYPAMAKHQARPYTQAWREFSQHWPYTVPADLHEFCKLHGIENKAYTTEQDFPPDSFYIIQIGWFDFGIDYFALLPTVILKKLHERQCRVLFYYFEGDDPHKIRYRLDKLCKRHQLDDDSWLFISGNTAADQVRNMCFFSCHELLYWHRNQECVAEPPNLDARPYNFTILNRTHKWWRATVMADLQRHGILDRSLWSYNPTISLDEGRNENPIEEDSDSELRQQVTEFVSSGPHTCDSATADQHNDHTRIDIELFQQSYCQVILETHFDADGSGGAFVTEKTFKALKYAQPFVIAGTPGSIQCLRDLGYRTFDSVIDHSYDSELNNTDRWKKLLKEICRLDAQGLDNIFKQCVPDLIHNQQLFLSSKQNRLLELRQKLNEKTQQLYIVATT